METRGQTGTPQPRVKEHAGEVCEGPAENESFEPDDAVGDDGDGMLGAHDEIIDERRADSQGEAADDVDEVVIAQVDGRKP